MNLMSLFFGMLSLVFMYKVAYILTKSKVFSLIPVFTMAFTFSFWSQSTEAEVYTLNSFFLTFTLYNFLMFYQEKKRIYLYVGILFYAISFGNHLSMLFLLPGLVYVIYITDKLIFKDIKVWIFSFVSVVLGASEYLYIWGRFKDYYNENLNAIWKEGEVYEYVKNSKSVYDAFFSYITGGQFKQELFQGFQYNITLFPKIFGGEFFLNTDSFFGYVVVMFLITTLIVFLFYGLFYFKKIVIYAFYIVFVSYSTFI
ncbi:DUF2723 domain-containing protein, partial [Sulfurihydrogenibium sp.]|uniref:protein O-mannosyl-transferase family n=1 Tax=Sulfurihydrogenibium sp. TaxID=2053621 RepID=UPI0026343DAA